MVVATIVNVEMHENLINVLNNVSVVFIIVMVSQMYIFQESRTNDMGQVRQGCSCLNSE